MIGTMRILSAACALALGGLAAAACAAGNGEPVDVEELDPGGSEPQGTWSNCSDDGRLCYTCSDDGGVCVCNWFYDGVWQATTDCGSGAEPDR
jgi:hypothetical protein